MKRTKLRLTICSLLLVAILAFIWGNSAMPGQESGELSGWVAELLQTVFPFLSLESGVGMYLLRKLAHFSEFCALGLCLGWLLGMMKEKPLFWLPWLCGTFAAVVDETIQLFSPGRYSSPIDVSIDSCGVLAGVTFLLLCTVLTKKKTKTK